MDWGRAFAAATTFGGSEAYRYLSKDGNLLGKAQTTPTAPLDPSQFQYGAGPNSDIANQIAQGQVESGLQQQAGQAEREGAFYNQANGNFDIGNAAQMRTADQIHSANADKLAQLQALQMTGNAATNLNNTGDRLTALGTAPMGPSYAEAQLHQGLDQGMAQQLAMARGGRSLGSWQAAMNQAAFNNAGLAQQTNQAAASARIQEQNNYDQFQLGALGQAGQQYGSAGNMSGLAGQQATGIRQGNEGVQLQNAQLNQGQQQINNATTGMYNQLGQAQQQLGMQANAYGQNAQQFGVTQGTHALDQQLGANTALATGNAAIQHANNAAEDQAAANKVAGDRQMITDGIKTGVAASDERVKTNIQPIEQLPMVDPNTPGFSGNRHPDDSKARFHSLGESLAQQMLAPPPPPPPPNYAQRIAALNTQYAPGARAPVDVLNHVPGAGAGPSGSQASLLAYMRGQGQPPRMAPSLQGAVQGAQIGQYAPVLPARPIAAPMLTSDAHSKTRIAELEGQLAALQGTRSPPTASFAPQQPDTAALDQSEYAQQVRPAVDLTAARGYSYDYKQPNSPGAAPGRQVGPMAQDLEHTAAANTVHDTPHGKQVDTGRLTMVNTAALSELQRKMQALEALQMQQPPAYDSSIYPQTQSPGI